MDIIVLEYLEGEDYINRVGIHIANLPGIYCAVENEHQAFKRVNDIYKIGFNNENRYKSLEEFKKSEEYQRLDKQKIEIYQRVPNENSHSFKFIESNF